MKSREEILERLRMLEENPWYNASGSDGGMYAAKHVRLAMEQEIETLRWVLDGEPRDLGVDVGVGFQLFEEPNRPGNREKDDRDNKKFSDRAHLAAREQLYPQIFKVPAGTLAFEDTQLGTGYAESYLDGKMATDRIVLVKVPEFDYPLQFTVQERFREPRYAKFRDITITTYNRHSGLPSELFKLNANLFLYGYYDAQEDYFVEAVVVNVADMARLLCAKKLPYKPGHNENDQDFIAIKFDDLRRAKCIIHHEPSAVAMDDTKNKTIQR